MPPPPFLRRAARLFCWLSLMLGGNPMLPAAPVTEAPPPGWWRSATFYEVFVRSFADATTGPLAGDGIGDLSGLIEHLDYLNDGNPASTRALGVTALWLMPIQPSPSYHGYDVTDYFAVNPRYGDLAQVKQLVREAHRRGIRVILDLVLNHASSHHPFFQQALADPRSPERSWFRFAAAPEGPPAAAARWHAGGGSFYYGFFSAEMPDWNLPAPAVTAHHRRVAAFWLNEIGVDGFRLDAVRYLIERGDEFQDTAETKAWLREFTAYCHHVKPGSFVIGECYADSDVVADYLHATATDSLFEFDLAQATLDAARQSSPDALARQLARLRELYGAAAPWANFLANHDQVRTRTQLAGRLGPTRLAAELQFTEPGVPFIYYGEEIGMVGAKPDPDLRSPMQWTGAAPNAGFTSAATPWHPVNPDATTVNVADESRDPTSLLSLYRRLIRMNAGSPALRQGTTRPVVVAARPGVFATARETPTEVVLILANLGEQPAVGCTLGLDRSNARPDWPLREILQGVAVSPPAVDHRGGFAGWHPLAELAPQSVYVFRWLKP